MNLFVTSSDPEVCAEILDDRRLIKQILECRQVLDGKFRNHPITRWVQEDEANFYWTAHFLLACCREYHVRFPAKYHAYHMDAIFLVAKTSGRKPDKFLNLAGNRSLNISYIHIEDVHVAYLTYLNDKWDADSREPKWTGRY